MAKDTKRNLEDVDTLQKRVTQDLQKIRELKRADSEINLKMVADKTMSDEIKDIKEVMKCCYDYIAQHRVLTKKQPYGNHLE